MDYRNFAKLLLNQLLSTPGAQNRHIIRFRNRKSFLQTLRQLQRTRLSNPTSILPLKMINALSCTLQSHRKLASFPFVSSVELDTKMNVHHISSHTLSTPSHPVLIPWGIRRIKVHQAWKHSKGNQVGVGVIDTGIDYSHPDLRTSIGKGINLVYYGLPPYDDNGHGTHIAGTIAAAGKGMMGVAPQAIIHPIKAFDRDGSALVSDIIYGMDWCVRNRIPIINMSFGMKKYSEALEDAVKAAYRSGTIIVASSGNDGRLSHVDFPARFEQSISVGATDEQKKIAPFSNRGEKIDIYAPGNHILSTWLSGKYNKLSGTSMATSHVSGVIALMLAKKPHLKPGQIKKILQNQATPLPQPGKKASIFEINARKSLHSLIKSK